MKLICRPGPLRGRVEIPGSKSHTIRAVVIASLADGESRIEAPLVSADAMAAVRAYRALGARIEMEEGHWTVNGIAGQPKTPDDVIDVANSGTTMSVLLGSCALLREGSAVLTGDPQVRRRPADALAKALADLGAPAVSTRGNGCPPFVVGGPLRGGRTSIEAVSSQYLTSLLLACPLAAGDTEIDVPLLNEKPYVEITLDWLRRQDIAVSHDELRRFQIPGGQRFKPFARRIPADYSSATFFLCAGALPGCDIASIGLDPTDPQGDKAVVDYLGQMGARIEERGGETRVTARDLRGVEIDLNATPDALPMLAALACFARGRTRLLNVPQARIKETDRIAVMAAELRKMGARIEELPDGLVIEESLLRGAAVNGHGDHRVVMALAVAATAARGDTVIDTVEAIEVTFPTFIECMRGLGADARILPDGEAA